jgi:hypothetical protein
MIVQMRWIDAQRVLPEDLDRNLRTVRVLQYRVDPSLGLGNWTEWQDVPLVLDATPKWSENK